MDEAAGQLRIILFYASTGVGEPVARLLGVEEEGWSCNTMLDRPKGLRLLKTISLLSFSEKPLIEHLRPVTWATSKKPPRSPRPSQTSHENRNDARTQRNEWYKTLAAAVVPFLTLATLAFTIWTQKSQLNQSFQASADAGWRDTSQKVLSQLRPNAPDALLAIELLRPYFRDRWHGAEAVDLAMFVASRVPDERVATIVYADPEVSVTADNMSIFLNRTREVRAATSSLDEGGDGRTVPQTIRSRARKALDANLRLLCGKLSDALRAGRIPGGRLDLHGAYLFGCTLEGVNLSNAVLTETTFDQVDLTSTKFIGVSDFQESDWTGSNWWDAREVDGALLAFLRDNYYPYAGGNSNYSIVPPLPEAYQQKLLSLCKSAKVECSRTPLQYGPQPTTDVLQTLAALSVPAVATLVTSAYERATVTTDPGSVEERQAIDEWLRAGLCDSVADSDARSKGSKKAGAPGSAARQIHCGSTYGDVRQFLNSIVASEYAIVMAEASSQPKGKLPESVAHATAGARKGATSLSPDSSERQLHQELIELHLCELLTPEELLKSDRENHRAKGSSGYGLNCSAPDYEGIKDLVVSGLLPHYLATLTRK